MKVVHVVTVSESLFFIRGQAAYFDAQGVDLVAISSPDPKLNAFGENEGIRTIGVPMARKISPFSDVMSIWRLVHVLRKERPDIVHAHTPKGGLLGTIASRIARVPVTIYQIHGLPYMGLTGILRRLLMTTEKISSSLADVVVSVSQSIAEVAINDRIVARDKVRIFLKGSGNGIDTRILFNPANVADEDRASLRRSHEIPEDGIVCLYVGRITGDKGMWELAEAWQSVSSVHPQARLIVVGSQDARLPLEQTSLNVLENDPSIVLAGRQDNTAVYYAAADIVVLPSYREGFPTVLLEASAMGVATIATRIPGCIDAVEDGVTGDIVPVRDAAALSDAINALIDDTERRKSYGAAGRKRTVENFDSQLIYEAVLAEYRHLVAAHEHTTK